MSFLLLSPFKPGGCLPFLFTIIFICFSVSAHNISEGCEPRLLNANGRLAGIAIHMESLHPGSSWPRQALELYLALKQEEQHYLKTLADLPDDLSERLVSVYSDKFDLKPGRSITVRKFYLNLVRHSYLRAADSLKAHWLSETLQAPIPHAFKTSSLRMMSRLFLPYALEDRTLTVEHALARINERPWLAFPWSSILNLPVPPENMEFREAERWLAQQPACRAWSVEQTRNFALAMSVKSKICCVSESGCINCPNNRAFRRKLN